MKRLLNSTFLLFVLLSMIGLDASAHDIAVENADGVTIYYNFINNTKLEVTYRGSSYDSYSNEYSGNVVIPESVTYNEKIYSVTSIGETSFYSCSVKSITIPNSVTSIGGGAFGECSGLTSIIIPNSVTSIGSLAFYRCSGLTTIKVQEGNTKYDSRSNCNAIIETATNTLVTGCKNTVIPNSVTSIGSLAFYRCSGLTSITIPNSVTTIGEWAFRRCSGLTSITIPNSVTSIGEFAFEGCSGLTSVTIPNSVTSIEYGAFSGCSGLTSVTIPNSVTSIGGYAFESCSGLTSVTIPNSVTSIGSCAFESCSGLTSVTIPNSVTSIGSLAFYKCSGLTSVYSYIEEPTSATVQRFDNSNYSDATLYVPKGTKGKYLATDDWKNFNNMEEFTYELGTTNLNSKGYATFSYASDVEVEGADVYTAVKNGNKISCTKVEQVVPAYNGVILKGEPNAEVTLNYIYTGQDELAGNELKATTTATGTAASETALVLSGNIFMNYTGGDFVADKAYMPYDGNSANAIEMVFDGATAIEGIGSKNNLLDGAVIKTIENGKLVIKTANGKYSSVGAKMK